MDNDTELWRKWKTTQSKKDFQKIYEVLKPEIHKASQRAAIGSNIPESAHRIWAAQSALEAMRTFKPVAGASLKTHVYGSVQQKGKRLNYKYQNLGHMPEPRAMQVGLYQTTHSNLLNELNREPSAQEIADRMNMGVRDVERLQKEVRKDLALVEGLAHKVTFQGSRDEEILDYTYHDLNPQQRVVYEYIVGMNGKPKMLKKSGVIDYDKISRATMISQSKLRQLVKQIEKTLKVNLER